MFKKRVFGVNIIRNDFGICLFSFLSGFPQYFRKCKRIAISVNRSQLARVKSRGLRERERVENPRYVTSMQYHIGF